MKVSVVAFLPLLIAVNLLACGGSSSTNPGAGGGSDVPDNGDGFLVEVTGIAEMTNFNDPPNDPRFVAVMLKVRNDGASKPIGVDPSHFSLKTGDGIVVPAATLESTAVFHACTDVGVAEGGSTTCGVAFKVANGDRLAEIEYADGELTAAAPIRALPKSDVCVPLPLVNRPNFAYCFSCTLEETGQWDGLNQACRPGEYKKLQACEKAADECACDAMSGISADCKDAVDELRGAESKRCGYACGF